jgi:hypothetical protein
MKKLFLVGLLVALPMPGAVMAQSDFDGTWKIDVSRISMPTGVDVFLLQNGLYQCKSCVPLISVKADGEDHSVAGNLYYDSISIKVLDDHTVEQTERKNGKTVTTSKMTVSPDGGTAVVALTDSSNTNADPIIGTRTMTREAKAKRPPTGSHAISGSWRMSKTESLSDNALMFTFMVESGSLNMTNLTGQSYTANLDGTDAPYKGDPGINAVSIARLGKDTFVETQKRDGKAIRIKRVMVTPDNGKTINVIETDNLRGTTTVFVANKQ